MKRDEKPKEKVLTIGEVTLPKAADLRALRISAYRAKYRAKYKPRPRKTPEPKVNKRLPGLHLKDVCYLTKTGKWDIGNLKAIYMERRFAMYIVTLETRQGSLIEKTLSKVKGVDEAGETALNVWREKESVLKAFRLKYTLLKRLDALKAEIVRNVDNIERLRKTDAHDKLLGEYRVSSINELLKIKEND